MDLVPDTTTAQQPEVDEFKKEGALLVQEATALRIETDAQYLSVEDRLVRVKTLKQKIVDKLAPTIQATDRAHKAACALRTELLAQPNEAERIYKNAIAMWDIEQARQRRVREAQAQEEAKKRQDEAALEEAQSLEAAGNTRAADAVIAEAASSPAPVVEHPKFQGSGMVNVRPSWGYRIIIPEEVKREYMIPDAALIKKTVQMMGRRAEQAVGGIEVIEERVVSAKRLR